MNIRSTCYAFTLISLAVLPSRLSAGPDPVAMQNSSKVKIFQIIGAREPDENSNSTFVLCAPGIPLDTSGDLTDPEQVQLISDVLNRIPLGDVYGGLVTGQVDADTVPSVYGRIVAGYRSTLPDPSPSDVQKLADLKKAWSDKTDKYNKYYAAWVDAVAAAKWAAVSPDRAEKKAAPKLQATADSALDDLDADDRGNSSGYRDALNAWYNFQDQMTGGEPWGDRVDAYRRGKNRGFPVKTWPQYSNWTASSGWTKVTVSSSDLHSSKVNASGGWSFGPFSVGGSYANSKSDKHSRAQGSTAGLEIPDVQILGWFCEIIPKCPLSEPAPSPTAQGR